MILQQTRPVQGGLRQERKFETVSNHLANLSTPGFKGDVLSFDAMFQARLNVDLSQGPIQDTGNKLDMALTDEGFFKVGTPQGIRYTRNGSFSLDNNGFLVTQGGDPVLGKNGPITIDGEDIFVNQGGEIVVDGAPAGIFDIVTLPDLENLRKEGSSNFIYMGDNPEEIPPLNIAVQQGALEGANVSSMVEMTKMIENHRMYESYQKMIKTFDETDGKVIDEVGRIV
jgi:flagellar basal-body rod protein FlgG